MGPDLVFYDGACGLCHRAVLFLLARDPLGLRFRYAPLQGATARARLSGAETRIDSLVVLCVGAAPLLRSQAILHLLRVLGGGWGGLAGMLAWVPQGVADWGYDRLASWRHRWFARPSERCPRLPAGLAERFLP